MAAQSQPRQQTSSLRRTNAKPRIEKVETEIPGAYRIRLIAEESRDQEEIADELKKIVEAHVPEGLERDVLINALDEESKHNRKR